MKNRDQKKRGILLVTTLFIVALLTALTLGFIEINRDSLLFAQKVNESEAALQAAYAGVHYAMMRFEQSGTYGVSTSSTVTAFGTSTTPVFNTPGFITYEKGVAVVGILGNNESHFQVVFDPFGDSSALCANNAYDDNSIASGPIAGWTTTSPGWEFHSLNNLNSPVPLTVTCNTGSGAGKIVPAYSAHIISTGYSHGVTRTVEAMLKRVFFSNFSVLTGSDFSVNLNDGNSRFTIASLDANSNSIEAGAKYSGGRFQQTGGNITIITNQASTNFNQINFGSSTRQVAGKAYALRSPGAAINGTPPGLVNGIGSTTYPNASGIQFVTTGKAGHTGTFYAKADAGVLPPNDLTGADILKQAGSDSATDAGGRYYPTNNPCWISVGATGQIWAFKSNNGYGNMLQAYKMSNGTTTSILNYADPTTPTAPGTITCANNPGQQLNIYGYKVRVPPGLHVVVGDSSSQTVQGNLMLTLDPSEFPVANSDPTPAGTGPYSSEQILPSLSLAYSGDNQMESSPSSFTMGGNLYVQGNIMGNGAVVVQANSGPGAIGVPNTNFSPSWAKDLANFSDEIHTDSSNSGGLFLKANSQYSRQANYSITLYSEGDSGLNTFFTNGGASSTSLLNVTSSTDKSAFANALNKIAGGTCNAVTCSGGYWNSNIPNIGEPLSGILDYGHDSSLNGKLTTLFRSTSGGLDSGSTGKKSTDIANLITDGSDANVKAYFTATGLTSASTLNLYQYTVLSNYAATGDSSWTTNYRVIPTSGLPDPVENFMTSMLNQFGQQAEMNDQEDFGKHMSGSDTSGSTRYFDLDMTFQGFVYTKGLTGFLSPTADFAPGAGASVRPRFGLQGSIIATQGIVKIGNGNWGGHVQAQNVDFLYDPSFIKDYYKTAGGVGLPITVKWMVVW